MEHRYLLLLDNDPGAPSRANPTLEAALRTAGMTCRLRTASARLFVSAGTPTLRVPGRGLVVGRLFSKAGEPIAGQLDVGGTADQLVQYLLQDMWGQYVAIYVNEDGGLVLLRDPSGAVPCVYSLGDRGGFITSDISFAVELGLYRREVDWQAVAHGLAFPYLRTKRTALKHVCELLPGSTLTCQGRNAMTRSAWSPWRFVAPGVRHADPYAAASDVRAAVSGVVATLSNLDDRFMVELSGGLDSSIVAACLSAHASRATFCTLVMPVAGTDERPYAKLVTDSLGRELLPVEVGFDHVRFAFPSPPSSVAPAMGILQYAVNEAWEAAGSQHHVDGFFSGGGGDTVFCYLKTAVPAADAFMERGMIAGLSAVRDLSALHHCTVWKAGKLALRKLRMPRTTWKIDGSFLDPAFVPAAPDYHPWLDAPPDALPGDREKIQDLIGTQLFRDTALRGQGRSMHFPLLTQPVLEACLKVPTWMWIAGGRNRAVARDAFADRLPRGILERRSKGSYTGYMAAVYARNKPGMRRFLEEGELCAHGLLDRSALEDFFARELAARDLSFLRIFDLCAAENWVRHQVQSPIVAPV
ncbi:asparagine synthase-related protein [[Pseudomonas] boreopolis]|uniref:asparagine synthase-related protein n=1 Tax=Xanthomonas boreopolis TaxID=86183 RepID=UPI003DA0A1C8